MFCLTLYLSKIYRIDANKVTYPEIKSHEKDVVIQKSRQSVFIGTPFELVLKNNGIKTLIFTGCQTDCCVEATLRDAALGYDYLCVLLEDCIASFNIDMHEAQMKINKRHFDVMQSEELIELCHSQK